MRTPDNNNKFLATSIIFHVSIVVALVMGFDMTSPMPVFENTNKNDVISAVVLGDTEKSKIITESSPPPKPKPKPEIVKEEPKPQPAPPKPVVQAQAKPEEIKKDVIALKAAEKKKKLIDQAEAAKKQREMFEKSLLADIKKQADKPVEKKKKEPQKDLKAQFEKTLRAQSEKSLRQQLLNEEIKLQGTQSRQAQGEVNKYKALIIQAISQQWIIPIQANKKLSSELMIRIAPGGMVLDVQITRTSGDPALDSSARAAVLKASPLPVPSDPAAFESFRQFVLKVKPENILNQDLA